MTHYNVNDTSGELLYVDNGRGMVLDKSDMSYFKVRMEINSYKHRDTGILLIFLSQKAFSIHSFLILSRWSLDQNLLGNLRR